MSTNGTPNLFAAADPLATLSWYCAPSSWTIDSDTATLIFTTDGNTDYWQRTHYGFRRDNGHFLYIEASSDVVAECRVRYTPQSSFDQAGLMVRFSADEWIKSSVEMESDGSFHLGAVVTRAGYSDWSTQAYPNGDIDLQLQLVRVGNDFTVRHRGADGEWQQLRVTHLSPPDPKTPLQIGVYAASPDSGGCTITVPFFSVSASPK